MLALGYAHDRRYAAGGDGGYALVHAVVGDVAMFRVDADPVEIGRAGDGAAEVGSREHLRVVRWVLEWVEVRFEGEGVPASLRRTSCRS